MSHFRLRFCICLTCKLVDKGALAPVQPRPVFGVPLQEAVSIARVREGFDLPAVVFRCVEYLQAKSAEQEEGLYRLSYVTTIRY